MFWIGKYNLFEFHSCAFFKKSEMFYFLLASRFLISFYCDEHHYGFVSVMFKIISWPVSYVSQVIKSHFCSVSHLTPCLTCTSVFSSLEYPTELRVISWVVLSQWILKVFSWGSDKTMSGVRELGHHA